MKSCSLSVRITAPLFCFHAICCLWGMHMGEELLSKSSRLDVNV